jgi:hypothetical protein
MILIVNGLHFSEIRLAFLHPVGTDQGKHRYFSTSEQLIAYLKDRPNQLFELEPTVIGQTLSASPADTYGPEFGDVFCGAIHYDPAKGQVLTKLSTGRQWAG